MKALFNDYPINICLHYAAFTSFLNSFILLHDQFHIFVRSKVLLIDTTLQLAQRGTD